jgi:hypothetical protein
MLKQIRVWAVAKVSILPSYLKQRLQTIQLCCCTFRPAVQACSNPCSCAAVQSGLLLVRQVHGCQTACSCSSKPFMLVGLI